LLARPGMWAHMSHLGALPDIVAVFGVVLDNGQNASSHDAVGFAEVAVDFLQRECDLLLEPLEFLRQRQAATLLLLRRRRP
jgi:hypothetical protein